MIYTYSDCAGARKCGAHKSRKIYHGIFFSYLTFANKKFRVYFTTFVRPSLTRGSTIGVKYTSEF